MKTNLWFWLLIQIGFFSKQVQIRIKATPNGIFTFLIFFYWDKRCKEKLNTLAISVMNQWPGVHLRVTEGWDEEGHHASDSLHYEGRAVDITTSDRDRSKYGMLARLAVDAGFDWVYYESRAHIHCSVKSESAEAAKYGGCFSEEAVVTTPTKTAVKVSELKVGEQVLAFDPATKKFVFSQVMLFLDWDPLQRRDFVEVQLESGKTLTITPTHLVVKGTIDFSKSVFAETLVTGDTLLVRNSDDVYRDRVVNVTRVFRTGVYAPLTDVGTIVANDVIVSCYAVVNSHYLAHWVFIPVRLTHSLRDIFYTILQVVSDYTGVVQKQLDYPSRGVHWYPDYIYRFTKNFIPFDIIH